jgi:hypothetical protein
MEVERPRPLEYQENEVSTLPPPPAPFPTELFRDALENESRAEVSVSHTYAKYVAHERIFKDILAQCKDHVSTL